MAVPPSVGPRLQPVTTLPPVGEYLAETWRRRRFAMEAPKYELQAQNLHRVLGNVWLVLNPALQVLTYYLVFGVMLDTRDDVENFLAYLTIGVFVFNFSQRTIISGSTSIINNYGLIRSIRFPRALLPISTVVAQTLAFLPVLVVMFGVVLVDAGPPSWTVVFFPFVLGMQILFNLGASFFLARANLVLPDVENLLSFVFRLAFYVSGILYSVEAVVESSSLQLLFYVNPFFAIIDCARYCLIGDWLGPASALSASLWTLVALVGGFAWFRAGELTYGRA